VRPLAVDLYCGLGGWTEGLLAEGYDVIGFDTECHVYGEHRYPAQLVIQDVRTLHGSQLRDATLIVASPPCQKYSWMAMPWKQAKAKAAVIRADETGQMLAELNELFDACFRIQAEASIAAGHRIPMVVENVRGAQPWVGRSRWAFGSFHLWGDVPALMPTTLKVAKVPGLNWSKYGEPGYKGEGFNTHADRQLREAEKVPGFRFGGNAEQPSGSFQSASVGIKNTGGSWFADGRKQKGSGAAWWDKALDDRRKEATAMMREGTKVGGGRDGWFGSNDNPMRRHHSGHKARRFASALIAKIPLPLSRHIAATFHPRSFAEAAE
jgi:hypothetical protein